MEPHATLDVGVYMTLVMVCFKIKDFATWKSAFDAAEGMRDAVPFLNTRVYRSAEDPTEVYVLSETSDAEKAKQFLTSPDVRAVMEKAGMLGPPKSTFLSPV
jgi:hypothetical protein